MEILTLLMMLIGLPMWVIGSIWFLFVAFRANPAVGLACLFIPCFEFVCVFQNWKDFGKPFLIEFVGKVVFILAVMNLPSAT